VVKHIVKDVRKYRPIDTVVLLVDETLRLAEKMVDYYPDLANGKDLGDCLRTAFLDSFSDKFDFKVALVLSCLTVTSLGKTFSDRAVRPFLLPGHLNAERIVNSWWDASQRGEEERRRLRLLAEAMSDAPRVVEYAGHFIKNHDKSAVDKLFVLCLIIFLNAEISKLYPVANFFPSRELLYNMIFRKVILMDTHVLECVKGSLITNSLEHFLANSTITPEINIFILGNAAEYFQGKHSAHVREVYVEIINALQDADKRENISGDFFWIWLKFRIQIAQCCPQLPLTLGKLLGIESEYFNEFSEIKYILREEFQDLQKYNLNACFKVDLEHSSYTKVDEFINTIENMSKYEVCRSAKGEAFDGVIKLFKSSLGVPYYIFWELGGGGGGGCGCRGRGAVVDTHHQYRHIKRIMNLHKKLFLFVYFTTSPGESTYVEVDCLVINAIDACNFFGPIWRIFKYSRGSVL